MRSEPDVPGRSRPEVVLVAAVAANGVIGRDNAMPWHLPEDLRRFKSLTMGRTIVMGRHTYDSIGRPLPGRRTVVITRDRAWAVEGVRTAASLAAALALADGEEQVMVVGGGQIYAESLPLADRLEITHVEQTVEGDVVFPVIDPAVWEPVEEQPSDGCRFTTYRRR